MPTLQAIRGRLVEVHRFTNVHLYVGRRPLGPTERYELWLKQDDGAERKFTINTRTMPARQGHVVSLIVTGHKVPQVLGLANWTAIDGVNYARTDAPSLVRTWDFVLLSAAFLTLAILGGDIGMVLFVPAAVAYLLAAGLGRAMARTRRIAQVDRAIDAEARRMSRSARRLQ